MLSAILLSVTGIRWQMLPVLAGAAFALPFALSPCCGRSGAVPADPCGGPAGGWRCRDRWPASA